MHSSLIDLSKGITCQTAVGARQEERKETNRTPSTKTSINDMRDQVKETGEIVKAQADTSTDLTSLLSEIRKNGTEPTES